MSGSRAQIAIVDDLGFTVALERRPERVVSLVPSWTETLFAMGLSHEVVGITTFCTEPAQVVADLPRVGGTKNPDLRAIVELAPALVVANAEENRREDIEYLRRQRMAVYVTFPKTVAGAVESILGVGRAIGRPDQADLIAREIVRTVSGIETGLGAWSKLRMRVLCPIWKNPWMVFNADTYAHDVLRMLGLNNVFASAGERYPRTSLDEALERQPDLVLLPDEPYRFGPRDVDALKALLPPPLSRRVMLVSGRDLHWYGVRMIEGLGRLASLIGRVRASLMQAAR